MEKVIRGSYKVKKAKVVANWWKEGDMGYHLKAVRLYEKDYTSGYTCNYTGRSSIVLVLSETWSV